MEKWECIACSNFNDDIVITDPSYLNLTGEGCDGYDKIDGYVMESHTFYGDWGCTVFKTDDVVGKIKKSAKEIGKFCADSGRVCVIGLKEALVVCPDFLSWLKEHDWCATIVKDFNGSVRFMTKTTKEKFDDGREFDDVELHVRGDGTSGGNEFSFESIQTSL